MTAGARDHDDGDRAEVAARIARFRRSWHASDLWPGVTEADFLAATAAIAAVVRQVGHAGDPIPFPGSDRLPARVLGIAAGVAGMAPLLGYLLERGRVHAPDDVAALFAAHLDHSRRRVARLGQELERVLEALHAAGVAATVLKGMHTARIYFPEPGVRPMADLDLLIDEAALPAAGAALATIGLTRAATVWGRSTWRPNGPRVPRSLEMAHADDPWDLDLHVTLDRRFADVVPARLGPVRPADLGPLRVGRQDTTCLTQPLLTALLALHVSDHLEMTGLMRLYELAAVIRQDAARGALDWDALLARLREHGAVRFVYPALALTDKLLPAAVNAAFLAAVRAAAPARVRRVVDRTEPEGAMRMYARPVDVRLMWLDGWRAWTRWVAWRAWPRIGDTPAPLGEAARLTAARVWRLLTGKMRLK